MRAERGMIGERPSTVLGRLVPSKDPYASSKPRIGERLHPKVDGANAAMRDIGIHPNASTNVGCYVNAVKISNVAWF